MSTTVSEPEGDGGASAQPPRKLHNLAYGIERIGLIPLRAPIVSAHHSGASCDRRRPRRRAAQGRRFAEPAFPLRHSGVSPVRGGDAPIFPRPNTTCWSWSRARTCWSATSIEKLRDLVTDLQLIDGVRGLISLFSARQPPEERQLPAPLFPEELPTARPTTSSMQRVLSNEIIRGKLLSEDGTLALIVLSLDPGDRRTARASTRSSARSARPWPTISPAQASPAQLSGVPVMQLEIRNAVERDRMLYNVIGFVAGCVIAILFFRRVSFMIIAPAPPLIAILLSLGMLGWLDFRLNMFLNVMTPLIMVISFSDTMQLTFAARDRLIAGEDKFKAFRNAILVVGPACVLTHGTAGAVVHRAAVLQLRPDPHLRRGRPARDRASRWSRC